jgi:hypothetical protein
MDLNPISYYNPIIVPPDQNPASAPGYCRIRSWDINRLDYNIRNRHMNFSDERNSNWFLYVRDTNWDKRINRLRNEEVLGEGEAFGRNRSGDVAIRFGDR